MGSTNTTYYKIHNFVSDDYGNETKFYTSTYLAGDFFVSAGWEEDVTFGAFSG